MGTSIACLGKIALVLLVICIELIGSDGYDLENDGIQREGWSRLKRKRAILLDKMHIQWKNFVFF